MLTNRKINAVQEKLAVLLETNGTVFVYVCRYESDLYGDFAGCFHGYDGHGSCCVLIGWVDGWLVDGYKGNLMMAKYI